MAAAIRAIIKLKIAQGSVHSLLMAWFQLVGRSLHIRTTFACQRTGKDLIILLYPAPSGAIKLIHGTYPAYPESFEDRQ